MYSLKINNTDFRTLMKNNGKNNRKIADIIGVHETYISQIANGKDISKLCAYAVCKAISPDLELNDLFKINL